MAWYWTQARPPIMTPPNMAGIRMNLAASLGRKRAKEAFRAMTALWKALPGNHMRCLVARMAASARWSPPVGKRFEKAWWYWRAVAAGRAEAARRVVVWGTMPAARSRPLMVVAGGEGAGDGGRA